MIVIGADPGALVGSAAATPAAAAATTIASTKNPMRSLFTSPSPLLVPAANRACRKDESTDLTMLSRNGLSGPEARAFHIEPLAVARVELEAAAQAGQIDRSRLGVEPAVRPAGDEHLRQVPS